MPESRGAVPEYESLVVIIKMNKEEINKISRPFLRWDGLTLDDYIEYIEKPGNLGDKLAIHLLAMVQGIHYCIITKDNIYYSLPNIMQSPLAVHMTLVYLRNKVFRDTTISKKGPPKYNLSKTCLNLLAHSPTSMKGGTAEKTR